MEVLDRINSAGGGGIAYIGNSRYGWGSPGNPGGGTGDLFDREFFSVLFNEGLEHAGVAHAAHKDAFAELARSNGYTRYTLYELNLLGDPETRIWTRNPVTATVVHASEIPLGEHQMLVTVSRDGEAVADNPLLAVHQSVEPRELVVLDRFQAVGCLGKGAHPIFEQVQPFSETKAVVQVLRDPQLDPPLPHTRFRLVLPGNR